jgi:hypothetical protein
LSDPAALRVELLRVATVGQAVPLGFRVEHYLMVGRLERRDVISSTRGNGHGGEQGEGGEIHDGHVLE